MRNQMLKMFAGTLFLLALLVPGARAAEVAGTVLYTSGKVTAVAADGASRDLQRRSPVYVGDVLQTGGSARAQVRFTDGSIVALKPGSELRLDNYADRGAADSTSVMSLLKGGFRTMTGAISQRNKAAYKVSTPVATIGVRGTLYEASWVEGEGLSLGVWDGGITACNEGGCVDLGMNADHRFGFVPVTGKPQGTTEQPSGIGDDREAGDGGSGGSSALDLLGNTGLLPGALQADGLFGPTGTVSRETHKQVGYAFIPGAGVVAASFSRVELDTNLGVTGFSLVDDSSGIEFSPGPPNESCDGSCFTYPSFSGSADTSSTTSNVIWGNWDKVSVGPVGDPNPGVSEAYGYFLMADYLSPSEVALFAQGTPTLNGNLNSSLSTFDLSGFGPLYANGNINITFNGAVTGNIQVADNSYNTWNLSFAGTSSGSALDLALQSGSNYMPSGGATGQESQVVGSVAASLFGVGGGNPLVEGVVGGVDVATVGANVLTGKVETLQGVFLMNGSCSLC